MTFKWYVLGIGVKLEPTREEHGKQLALIAAMGPVGSLLAGLLFLALAQIDNSYSQAVFASLFALNVAIAILNLIPTPITDGGHIITGLTGWKMKWRYLVVFWIIAELVAFWILFLN
jgi:Zn-dependent protease